MVDIDHRVRPTLAGPRPVPGGRRTPAPAPAPPAPAAAASPAPAAPAPATSSPATAPPTPATTPPATSGWIGPLSVLIVGSFMSVLDTSIVNIAIPRMQVDLSAATDDVEWVVTAYTLM